MNNYLSVIKGKLIESFITKECSICNGVSHKSQLEVLSCINCYLRIQLGGNGYATRNIAYNNVVIGMDFDFAINDIAFSIGNSIGKKTRCKYIKEDNPLCLLFLYSNQDLIKKADKILLLV